MQKLFLMSALIVATPLLVFANTCTPNGYTVVFVNGVLVSEQDANNELLTLGKNLGNTYNGEHLSVRLGYNATHLSGGGDNIQSIAQAFGTSVSDFDLNTILNQIHSEVTTRKILLVGHSQGTYYTNEMYKYLVANGVSKDSIAVYNIATPASFVAGGGEYVTSTNDKVINYVRSNEVDGNVGLNLNTLGAVGSVVNSALRGNITIPQEPGYQGDEWGGHHFSVYLSGAAPRIVSDMSYEMKNLKVGDTAAPADGCFTPPAQDLKYKTEAAAFMVADPIDRAVTTAASSAANLIASGLGFLLSPIINPPASPTSSSQTSAAALGVPVQAPVSAAPTPVIQPKNTAIAKPVSTITTPNAPTSSSVTAPATTTTIPLASHTTISVPPTNAPWPGYGGGGAAPNQPSSSSDSPSAPPVIPIATTSLAVTQPADNVLFATTTLIVSGTSDTGALVAVQSDAAIATTTADLAGNWSLSILLSEGPHTVLVQANINGVVSDQVSRTVTIDTVAPSAPSLSIDDCASSLVTGLCVLPETSTRLSWPGSPDAAYYAVIKNDSPQATTTSLESVQTIADNATTTFTVVAYDAAGNTATSTSVDVVGLSRSLVINEVSWAGDNHGQLNQWIELKNFSPYAIDLSHMTITRSGGDPIVLSGTIGASGSASHQDYAVIEPDSNPYTGSNPIISPFSPLSASGEQLSLIWNGSTMDTTPPVATCSGWCAGALNVKLGSNVSGTPDFYSSLSMERTKDASDGTQASSWHSTDSYGAWLGNGAAVWGTPGQQNSKGWPDAGVVCDASGPVAANQSLHPGSSCIFLMKFITGNTFGPGRYAGIFKGDVGSSIGSMGFEGNAIAAEVPLGTDGAQAGDHFFFAAIENRSWADDAASFEQFFTNGSVAAPHGNYITIPFTYAP